MAKLSRLILCVWLTALGAAWAQVEIGISTDRRIYVQHEPVKLKITLTNNSGANVTLRDWEDGYLNCDLLDEQGRAAEPVASRLERRRTTVVRQDQPVNIEQQRVNFGRGLTLATGAKVESTVNVNLYYDLRRPGAYKLRVRFNHRRLTDDYLSAPVWFDVKAGGAVVTKRVGVPGPATEAAIRARNVSLLDFRAETNAIYCLKIEDETMVYALERLSAHTAGDRPELEVDGRSLVHILVHTDPKVFTYWVFDLDGQLKQLSNYQVIPGSQPRLIRDPDIGRVMVVGGNFVRPGADAEMQLPSYKAP